LIKKSKEEASKKSPIRLDTAAVRGPSKGLGELVENMSRKSLKWEKRDRSTFERESEERRSFEKTEKREKGEAKPLGGQSLKPGGLRRVTELRTLKGFVERNQG